MRLSASMSFERAIGKLARREVRRIGRLLVDAGRGEVEAIHDVRAGLRRIRLLLELAPHGNAARLRKRAGRVARILGDVRDIDVALIQIRGGMFDPADTSSWIEELDSHRLTILPKVAAALTSARYRKFSMKIAQWSKEAKGGRSALDGFSSSLKKTVEVSRTHLTGSTDTDLHRLRIAVKKARYLVELFREVLPKQAVVIAADLEAVQDEFGNTRDRDRLLQSASRRIDVAEIAKAIPTSTDVERLMAHASAALEGALILANSSNSISTEQDC